MSNNEFFTIKEEPVESVEFFDLFPAAAECPFPTPIPHKRKAKRAERLIPSLWVVEKCAVAADRENGMADSIESDYSSKQSLNLISESKEDLARRLLPPEQILTPDEAKRAEELKHLERIRHKIFIETMLDKYPVDMTYYPNKARRFTYSKKNNDDRFNRQPDGAIRYTFDISKVSRYKRKLQRAVNSYTVIHLRERILDYQTRMSVMKAMLLQDDIDDLSSDMYDASSSSSLSLSPSPSPPPSQSPPMSVTFSDVTSIGLSSLSDFEEYPIDQQD